MSKKQSTIQAVKGFAQRPQSKRLQWCASKNVWRGTLLGAFRKHERREVKTATDTIGIRGTAVYVEANSVLTYVCTCYGNVDLECTAYRSTKRVQSRDHTPNYIFARVLSGRSIVDAPVINHTNAELSELEKLVGRAPVLQLQ